MTMCQSEYAKMVLTRHEMADVEAVEVGTEHDGFDMFRCHYN
jgi:hypothetical protein